MTLSEHRNSHYAGLLAADPGRVRDARLRAGGDGVTADPYLRARRLIEYELNAGPHGIGEWNFRQAAGQLRAAGHQPESEILAHIADTSSLLDQVSREWHGRYLARPLTVAEENDARLLNTGQARVLKRVQSPGCDGALYVPARLEAFPGAASRLAVVITNDAATEEIVSGFPSKHAYQEWLADRDVHVRGLNSGSLCSAADGPWCRTAREELVLAFLINGGDLGPGLNPGTRPGVLQARAFSTYARSECVLAWRSVTDETGSGGPGTAGMVRRELERRLLRTPGWAADTVGWPFGNLAIEYAERLAVTPVTAVQARTAARELIREDAIAAVNARRRPPAPRSIWQLARPRPDDPSPGPVPRS